MNPVSGTGSTGSYADFSRISGLASGFDTEGKIKQLMSVERIPLNRLMQSKQLWLWKQEAYRSMNAQLTDLRNSVFTMKLQGTFQAKTVSSSNSTVVTATASPTATDATYAIRDITQLATVATAASANTVTKTGATKVDPTQPLSTQLANLNWAGPAAGSNTFSFDLNGQSFTFDTTKDSLNSVISAINANKAAGVTAFYDSVQDKISMTTTATGANQKMVVANDATNAVKDLFGMNVLADGSIAKPGATVAATGTDAAFTINGLATTRSTNTFSINGLTITLNQTYSGTSDITLQSSTDTDKVYNSIKDFVDKYNAAVDKLNKLNAEPRYRDYQPLTDDQKAQMTDIEITKWEDKAKSGMLKGDQLLTQSISKMRMALSDPVQGVTSTSGVSTLSQVGITTGQWYENGKLYINESKLRDAIAKDPDGVMQLFTNTGVDPTTNKVDVSKQGLAGRLYDAMTYSINQVTQTAGSDISLTDNSNIGQTIKDINGRITDMNRILADKQAMYYRQFTALETAMSRMNQQSSYLMSQFGGGGGGGQ